jgi:hypothetical protein
LALQENREVLITALTLQATGPSGKDKSSGQYEYHLYEECMQYWDQPKAAGELQVAMRKMKWPVYIDTETSPEPPAKKKLRSS